jgi:hypothetical protein
MILGIFFLNMKESPPSDVVSFWVAVIQ